MDRTQLAAAIKQRSLLHGDFLLRSRARSGEYFDKYRFDAQPDSLAAIATHLAALIPADIDALAGLLGDRPYMLGDKATSLDASAAGSLINILQAPLETPLKAGAARHANLVAYAERVRAKLKG